MQIEMKVSEWVSWITISPNEKGERKVRNAVCRCVQAALKNDESTTVDTLQISRLKGELGWRFSSNWKTADESAAAAADSLCQSISNASSYTFGFGLDDKCTKNKKGMRNRANSTRLQWPPPPQQTGLVLINNSINDTLKDTTTEWASEWVCTSPCRSRQAIKKLKLMWVLVSWKKPRMIHMINGNMDTIVCNGHKLVCTR